MYIKNINYISNLESSSEFLKIIITHTIHIKTQGFEYHPTIPIPYTKIKKHCDEVTSIVQIIYSMVLSNYD